MRERYLNFIANKQDTIAKIFSLVIAILLWFFIITEIDPTIKKDFTNVQVELRNQSSMREAGLELLKHDDYTTNIVVSGKRSAILGLKEEDISAYVDLEDVQPGTQRLPIHYRLSDDSLTIERSNPKAITVSVDEIVKEEKAVTVKSKGKPDDNYVLDHVSVSPEKVTISGPKREVDKVQSVVGFVNVSGAKDTVVSTVELFPMDQNKRVISNIDISPNNVSVQAVISKAVSVPINVNYTDENVEGFKRERAILTPTSVMITGEGEQIDKVEAVKTNPVDPRELMREFTITLTLNLPDGVHLVNPDESIFLRYMKNETSKRSLEIDPKSINMNGKRFKRPEHVTVEVYGEQNIVASINPEDLTVAVDSNGKLTAKGPKGVEVIQILPYRLNQ